MILFAIPLIFALAMLILGIAAYLSGPVNMWLTAIKEGTIKTVVENANFVRFIPNVTGHRVTPQHKIELGTEERPLIFGLYYVSWLWPIRKVYEFQIRKVRLKKNRDKIEDIADKIEVEDELTTVDHLRWKIDRPFFLRNVDLKDGSRIHILGKGIYTVWDAYQLLFGLQGEFFDNLDSLIAAYVVAKYKLVGIDEVRSKTTELNPAELMGPFDVKNLIGLICESLVIEEWSLSEEDQEMQDAIQAEKLALERKKATLVDADARAEATIRQGNAEAAALTATLAPYKTVGMTAADIAKIHHYDRISKLRGTFAEGGSNAMILAGNNPQEPEPVPTPAPQTSSGGPQPSPPATQNPPHPPQNRGGVKNRR
jgi:hypothetical protein